MNFFFFLVKKKIINLLFYTGYLHLFALFLFILQNQFIFISSAFGGMYIVLFKIAEQMFLGHYQNPSFEIPYIQYRIIHIYMCTRTKL